MEISPEVSDIANIQEPYFRLKNVPRKPTVADSCCNIARTSNQKHVAAVTLVEENDSWRQFWVILIQCLRIENVSTLEYIAIATRF